MPLTGFKDQTEQHSKHIVAHAGPVLQAMRRRSANNPVKSKEIETALGAGGPTVRAIISHLRRQGYPIVSNGKGYHYDETWEGILDTIRHLEQRRNAMDTVIKELQAGYDNAHKDVDTWARELIAYCEESECSLESGLENLRDFHDALGGELGQEVLNTAYAIDAQRDEPDGDGRKVQLRYHNKPGQRRSSLNPYKKTTY